jgi:hypothetical protein
METLDVQESECGEHDFKAYKGDGSSVGNSTPLYAYEQLHSGEAEQKPSTGRAASIENSCLTFSGTM